MSTIVISSQMALTTDDLKIIGEIKKSGVVGSGQTIMEGSAVTFTNLPSGVEKKTAARIVAKRKVEEYIASGGSLSEIEWEGPCVVTISAGEHGSVNTTGGTYLTGTELNLVATPDSGYQFEKWSDNNTNATRTYTVTAPTSLTASFVESAGQPNDEIWYTTTDDEAVNVYTNNNPFFISVLGMTGYTGPSIVSNTYENGKGIIKFDSDLTYIGLIGTESIGPTIGHAFDFTTSSSTSNLKTISYPSSMTTLGFWSLWECYNIVNFTIPDTVTNIDEYNGIAQPFVTDDLKTMPSVITSKGTYAWELKGSHYETTIQLNNGNYYRLVNGCGI